MGQRGIAHPLTVVVGLDAGRQAFLVAGAVARHHIVEFGPVDGAPGPIETGEKLIGISMPKYIVTKAPAPLGWAQLKNEPLMGSARGIAIAKNAPRPNAARLFVDYWLSEASSRILAEQVGEWVLYKDVYPPIKDIRKANVIPLRELSDDEIQRWSEVFRTIF